MEMCLCWRTSPRADILLYGLCRFRRYRAEDQDASRMQPELQSAFLRAGGRRSPLPNKEKIILELPVEEDDHDSGTESDDEHADIEDPETSKFTLGFSTGGLLGHLQIGSLRYPFVEGMESEGSASVVHQVCMGGGDVGGGTVSPYMLDSALASDNDLNYDDHHSSEEELENINSANLPQRDLSLARSRSASTLPEKRKWSQ
ncbi:hypothetical protein LSTR_LSTR010147, partial [Laodelphax striatellus]